DWRLGLSLLRVFLDPGYSCGLDSGFGTPELAGWLEQAHVLRNGFCSAFDCQPRQIGPLPGFEVGPFTVVIKHPLWDEMRPARMLAEALATVPQDTQRRVVDTFNILRRPSWVYQTLPE